MSTIPQKPACPVVCRIALLESGCHKPGTTLPSSTLPLGGATTGLRSGQWNVGRIRSAQWSSALSSLCPLDINAWVIWEDTWES